MYARATAGVVEEDIQSFSVLCAGLRVLYCDSVPSMSVVEALAMIEGLW